MIAPTALGHQALGSRLEDLGRLLIAHQDLWRPAPFKIRSLPWANAQPELQRKLEQLPDAQVDHFENDAAALSDWLGEWLPDAALIRRTAQVGALSERREPAREHRDDVGVPGRKWRQIQTFTSRLPDHGRPLLEWCSGKGHLGRMLHRHFDAPVTCVERDPRLTHAGTRMASEHEAELDFHTLDALGSDAAALVQKQQHAVALHACGQLHLRLMQLCVERATDALSLSPCCYHLIEDDIGEPWSAVGRTLGLMLTREELRIPLQETVTAPAGAQRRRELGQKWRLGFDVLQRQLRGVDEYLPVPPISPQWLERGFEAFCRHAAELKGLELAGQIDFDACRHHGEELWGVVRRRALVRQLFRRPLELWLVLDRAMYLVDHGYQVQLGTFCDRSITPRNLMVLARLP